jgi:hypothetical protein
LSKRTLKDWVEDVHASMRNIESDMLNMSEAEFLDDGKSIRAVAKSIMSCMGGWRGDGWNEAQFPHLLLRRA